MIESFFQSLEAHGVSYLLMSGQAAILYGAATFSEDVDLWVSPVQDNLERLRDSLRAVDARYYKITPPLRESHARKGHGFHFVLPDDPEVWLDVMGVPPRTRDFAEAASAANHLESDWGMLPTVSIEDLIEIKKTQRLDDYPVVSRLVLSGLEGGSPPGKPRIEWALENLFTLESLSEFLRRFVDRQTETVLPQRLRTYRAALLEDHEVGDDLEASIASDLSRRILDCQQADRQYWRPIIEDLRRLRREGRLVRAGERV